VVASSKQKAPAIGAGARNTERINMSDYTSNLTRQRVAYDPGYAGSLALVPPLASKETALTGGEPPYGLDVGGDDATRDAARDWALRHGYMQAVGLAPCAHGLYLMRSCPGRDCYRAAGLDHTQIWVPADAGERPFILTPSVRARDPRPDAGLRGGPRADHHQ
jgi:hypothetical protein